MARIFQITSKWNELIHPYIPLILVSLSGLGFSIQTLVVKLLEINGFKGSFSCVLSRGICQLIVCSTMVYFDEERRAGKGPKFLGDTHFVRIMMITRALIGYSSIAFSFLSVEYLSVGDSATLVMLSTIFTAVLGYFILGEPWRFPEFIGAIMALTGAVFVAKPSFIFGGNLALDPLGVSFALLSAISAAGAFTSIRILGTVAKMPFANICVIQALAQIIISIPIAYISGQPWKLNVGWYNANLIFIGGFVGCWSQIAMTIGMQREKSAAASAMRMSDVVFGFIWQILFTNDPASWSSIFGAALVTSSILFIILFKQVSEKKPSSSSSSSKDVSIKTISTEESEDEVYEIELYSNPILMEDDQNNKDSHHGSTMEQQLEECRIKECQTSNRSLSYKNHSVGNINSINLSQTSTSMLSRWNTGIRANIHALFSRGVSYDQLHQESQHG